MGFPVLLPHVLFDVPALLLVTCRDTARQGGWHLYLLLSSAVVLPWRRERWGGETGCLPLAFDVSVPSCTVPGVDAGGIVAEGYGSVALLRSPLPEAVCVASSGRELLMNSGFHLLSVVLNCFCTSESLMSLRTIMREERACVCARQRHYSLCREKSYLWTVLLALPRH